MPRWSLLPKEPKFFAFYEQQANNIVKMAQQLKDMVYVWQNLKERVSVLADMEQDGDAITHDIMRLLNSTYNTPLDKEDIPAMANALDNIADRIHAAADALYLYRIESPTERAKELCDIIELAALEVEGGISEMSRQIRKTRAARDLYR